MTHPQKIGALDTISCRVWDIQSKSSTLHTYRCSQGFPILKAYSLATLVSAFPAEHVEIHWQHNTTEVQITAHVETKQANITNHLLQERVKCLEAQRFCNKCSRTIKPQYLNSAKHVPGSVPFLWDCECGKENTCDFLKMDHDVLMMFLSWVENEEKARDFLEQYRFKRGPSSESKTRILGQVHGTFKRAELIGVPLGQGTQREVSQEGQSHGEPTFLTKDIVGGKRKSYGDRDSIESNRLHSKSNHFRSRESPKDLDNAQTCRSPINSNGDRDADADAGRRSPSPDPIPSPAGSQYSREGSPASSPTSRRLNDSPMQRWPFAEKRGEWKPEFTQTDSDDIYRSN